MDWKKLWTRLKGLRVARDLSQAELAARASTSRNTITLIEAGRRPASIRLLERLAKVLGVRLPDLLR